MPRCRSPLATTAIAGMLLACRLSLRSEPGIEKDVGTTFVVAELGSIHLRSPRAARGSHCGGTSQLGCAGTATSPEAQRSMTSRRALGMNPEVTSALPVEDPGSMLAGFAGVIALYCIMSLNEYVYHRYFQHLGINKLEASRVARETFGLRTYQGDGHVEHHRETLDDMSLDERPVPALDADPFRGTAFPWWATCAMIASVQALAVPVLSLLGWSTPVILVSATLAVLLHASVWNALHPNMHALPDVPLTHGPPSVVFAGFRGSPIFEWLRINHEGHHRTEGAHGNYNVCCPLMDQLVGTYVGVVPAAPVAKAAAGTYLGERQPMAGSESSA